MRWEHRSCTTHYWETEKKEQHGGWASHVWAHEPVPGLTETSGPLGSSCWALMAACQVGWRSTVDDRGMERPTNWPTVWREDGALSL